MYVKLFQKTLDSSINEVSLSRRWVWIALLLLADQDGNVNSTPSAIARRANVGLEEAQEALEYLQQPDETSTTPDEGGRRLIKLSPCAWHVVNYKKYREIATAEDGRRSARARMQAFRAGKEAPGWAVEAGSDRFGDVRKCSGSEGEEQAEAKAASDAVGVEQGLAILFELSANPQAGMAQGAANYKEGTLKRIRLNRETWTFEGITAEDRKEWQDKAPQVDIDRELLKLVAHVQENPKWAAKRSANGHWLATINKWLLSAQQHAEKTPARQGRGGTMTAKIIPPGCDQYGHELGAFSWARGRGLLEDSGNGN